MVATRNGQAGKSNSHVAEHEGSRQSGAPRSLAIAQRGVKSTDDFEQLMSALMSDLIDGSINDGVGNAVVNAGGKLLKSVELRMKYGSTVANGSGRRLELVG